jgi:hypothetical protein
MYEMKAAIANIEKEATGKETGKATEKDGDAKGAASSLQIVKAAIANIEKVCQAATVEATGKETGKATEKDGDARAVRIDGDAKATEKVVIDLNEMD